MRNHAVNVYFYGSYMNFEVLQEAGIGKRSFEISSISGYELTISPLANLLNNERGTAYGILTKLTHAELDRLYQDHAKTVLGGIYRPEAVVVNRQDGALNPALCYISRDMEEGKADAGYVDRILKSAKEYGFPEWYLVHIASFK